MLSEKNMPSVASDWNATRADYPRSRTVHALFEEWAAIPDAPAVLCGGTAITSAELNARANRLLTAGLFHLLVDQRQQDLAPLRQLVAGGDVLSPEHVSLSCRCSGGTATAGSPTSS